MGLRGFRKGVFVTSSICNFSTKGKKRSKSDGSDSNDENLSKKELALKQALDQITTSFGKGSIMWLGRSTSHKQVPVVSTGSFSLDIALGIGGLPKGRVVEIYGPEASGKTTVALHVIAEAQKQGVQCIDPLLRLIPKERAKLESTSSSPTAKTPSQRSSVPAPHLPQHCSSFSNIRVDGDSSLACGEDLGLIPSCVNPVIHMLAIGYEPMRTYVQKINTLFPERLWICRIGRRRSFFLSQFCLSVQLKPQPQPPSGYMCFVVDAEHALDPALAEAIGALSLVDTLIRSGSVDVVVVDQLLALVPKGDLDGEMGDAHMAMQARLMSQALRKLSHSLSFITDNLIFVNSDTRLSTLGQGLKNDNEKGRIKDRRLSKLGSQVRAKLSTFGFGGPTEVTCGGNALKFYASVRLNIRRTGLVKKGEEPKEDEMALILILIHHICSKIVGRDCGSDRRIGLRINRVEEDRRRRTNEEEDRSCSLANRKSSDHRRPTTRVTTDQRRATRCAQRTVGSQVLVKIVKNKHAPPFRTAQFELEFGKGICQETELIELGSKHKFITKGGAFYSMNGQSFRGKDAIKQYLAANPSVKEELMMKLREKLLDSEEDKGKESEAEAVDTDPTGAVVSSDTTDEEEISAVEA
ncbi:hypothetical protein HYC85_016134 [Camellia sinensis]|uniref:RecA family profile 1 domain-containing protein n=1 Tax=Camellia sinensis TaxID=4442 RepID=A0A7J7H2G7_CAMSI|nr:hypothetical protein HYC85_016134 [Camellia sinensis]